MERPLSSLAFRGSIVEAIGEAKRQKKLFVVYTAGDNPESKLLETSTWIDPKVSETLEKYCILLHIMEGSSEASNFSAIYPQHSIPCITAIGYNGVQLWQQEGLVSAEVLASSLEKAWLSLHVQETTAAFLTAALASREKLATGTSGAASTEQVHTGTCESSPSIDNHIPSQGADQPSNCETIGDRNSHNHKDAPKERDPKKDDVTFAEPSHSNLLENRSLNASTSVSESPSPDHVDIGHNDPKVACPVPEKDLEFRDNHFGRSSKVSQEIINNVSKVAHVNKPEINEVEKADALCSSAINLNDASDSCLTKSNDVHLNIRLPDGSSLQAKFSMIDTLKMVKDYLIENQKNSLGSFGLAIPYPRKVFNDQDLDSTLSELGLSNRQALVVVPSNQNSSRYGGGSSHNQTYSSNDVNSSNGSDGYWAYLKWILSYANPFSYLSGSTSPASADQESQSGIWEYSPNPSRQTTLRDGAGGSLPDQSTADTASRRNNNSSKSRQQTSRFGGNIHTLKHDEDEDRRFGDGNAFWNGNSTQFGGNDDGK